ncbi:hypothetical protein DZC30_02300 [Comamonas testosteroni]|uniref:Uncharacterized protein n=1 Tax=Comamonas testosteroni TaxID=285 RepID=A0A373FRY5_COMTE|nr:hypothetical protein DZC30_02300 [Comamonas testosteroni]
MDPNDYPAKSLVVQARLNKLGLTPARLQLIGAFVVAYGLFETGLERALWALTETSVKGIRPFTEQMSQEKQFARLGEGSPKLSPECNAVLKVAAQVAVDLSEYRNSLFHGCLMTFGQDGSPSFMKNPGWSGEQRKKRIGDAFLEEPIQDLVLLAAWTLARAVQLAAKAMAEPEYQPMLAELSADVARARSYASEARHLGALMNDERY